MAVGPVQDASYVLKFGMLILHQFCRARVRPGRTSRESKIARKSLWS